MNEASKIAVIGIGATGAVIAAALLKQNPEVICVDPNPMLGKTLKEEGIRVSGVFDWRVPVKNMCSQIEDLIQFKPKLIFISTKTYHLPQVLDDLKKVYSSDMTLISTHNGLGTEDFISEKCQTDNVLRMSLNFGISPIAPGHSEMIFFNPPNPLGSLTEKGKSIGLQIAELFSNSGLDTQWVDDIKLYVWRKMVFKCGLATICAVTNRTIGEVLNFNATREIAISCFNEAFLVAKAMGYDLGDQFLNESLQYLGNVGSHKDSMCDDVENRAPTEIDFLSGKILNYGHDLGIPTPHLTTMTNLIRALQDSYLNA